MQRGNRQESPVSSLLFVFVVEIFAIQIQNHSDIKGLKLCNHTKRERENIQNCPTCRRLHQYDTRRTLFAENMKESLVSKLTIPHASQLYHTGIFMKYNQVPLLKKLSPLTDFSEEQSYPCLIPSTFFTLTDNFSKFHVIQSTNEGAIQATTH
jgi:hypothetical protein